MNRFLALPSLLLSTLLTSCVAPDLDRAFPAGAPAYLGNASNVSADDVLVGRRLSSESLDHMKQAKWLPDDGVSSARFGFSVAIDGDTAVVGARGEVNQGSAYVFVRDGASWTQQAKLMIGDSTPGDNFGYSVAVSGDTALVGAFLGKNNGKMTGAAYVFTRSNGTWKQQEKLLASDGDGFDLFGESVALSGDTALVGAFQAGQVKAGEVYVFVRSSDTWIEQAKLWAKDGVSADNFGISIALSGDTVIVGADAVGAQGEASGAAYVFVREGQSWTEQAKVFASDKGAHKFFGNPVAISGDTAVVGTYLGNGQALSSGAAYLFARNGTTWTEQKKLTASDGASGDGFGISVAISGGTVAVGAFNALDDSGKGANSGAAYIFQKSCDGAWVEELKVAAGDGASGDEFGYQVALSGSSLLVGASLHDDQGADSGAAYFHVLASLLQPDEPCVNNADCASGTCLDGACRCWEAGTSGAGSSGEGVGGAVAGANVGSSVGSAGGAGGAPVTGSGGSATIDSGEWCPTGNPKAGAFCVLAAIGGGCTFHVSGSAGSSGVRPLGGFLAMVVLSFLMRRKAAS